MTKRCIFAFQMLESMLNTLSLIFKLHPFTPKVDEVIALLEKCESYADYKSTGVKILPYEKFKEMNINEYKTWTKTEGDFKHEGLKTVIETQNSEIKKCIAAVRSKYLDNIKCDELKNFAVSLQDLIYHLGYDLLKLKRLELIKNPKFTHTLGQHSRTKIKYDMVKIYWYDDHGELERNLNKNVGSTELQIIDLVAKIFSQEGYETLIDYKTIENGIKVDMLLSKGGKKWVAEVKQKSRDEMIKLFVSLELWRLYKKTYEID